MTGLEIGIYGVIGGSLPEILALYKLRHVKSGGKPDWLKSSFYWIVTGVMILLGGATAFIYFKLGIKVNELMAIHLGAATPLLISNLGKSKPDIS
jgi:hypothetical protein